MSMANTSNISLPIVLALYDEALDLSDRVRQSFDIGPAHDVARYSNRFRLALSVEGLRATTRVMHSLAWLLNFRAFLDGELSELQVRRHSRLPKDRAPEQENLMMLEARTQALIAQTQQLHERVARLDKVWRAQFDMQPPAVHRLRERLQSSFG